LRMAWEAGCGRTPVELELSKKTPIPLGSLVNQACNLSSLLVDRNGQRFMDEDVFMNGPYTGNALAMRPDRVGFMIFDATQAKAVEEAMKHPSKGEMFNVKITSDNIDQEVRELEGKNGHIWGADSLEELAQKAGIDEAGLKETVERYNDFCAKGVDEDFCKSAKNLQPICTPRFYAGAVYGGGYGTLGGIRANDNMEGLDPEGRVMPGFYAAGNEVCTIYAGTYYMNMPGNTMGFAVNSGRMAGENAAAYIRALK
ncbi:MAG: FAD-binding protein, partial [Clostridiales bacterium]|nr:FAD-binding protein [Clostridiales bacterium]